MKTDSIKLAESMTNELALKFLNTQLQSTKGIVKHNKSVLIDSEIGVSNLELAIKKLTYPKESCDLDYYAIRSGKCKYGETGGHKGDIFCENPNCTNR